MLKKTITYVDYNDVERTEDFYFNLTKVEITEMEASVDGGMTTMLEKIGKSGSLKEVLDLFKNIILLSVGKKSEDGRRFIKNSEIAADFVESPAFDELFMSVATDGRASAEFLKGILPRDIANQISDEQINKLVAAADSSETAAAE